MGALKNFHAKLLKYFCPMRYYKDLRARHCLIGECVDIVNSDIGDYVGVAHHASVNNSVLGKRTTVGRYSKIAEADMGAYCSVAWDVTIGALVHPIDRVTCHAFSYREQFGLAASNKPLPRKRTKIGNDVWIGCGAIIIAGVTVGDGAIIGAGSVVTADVEPYSIVVGVPAKRLRYRFDDETIVRLKNLEWWNLPDAVISSNMNLFEHPLDNETLIALERLKLNE